MNLKSVFLVAVIIGAVYVHESAATHKLVLLKAKAALIKGKIAAVKAPHVIAHAAVAADVKAKSKDALSKSWEAAKATKVAAWSAITAPFHVAKKTIALKIAGFKAAKALKAAKLAKIATIVNNLKSSPLLLPVPYTVGAQPLGGAISAEYNVPTGYAAVPATFQYPLPLAYSATVPAKTLPLPAVVPVPAKTLPALTIPAPPSIESALGPLKGIIAGAKTAIKSAGNISLFSKKAAIAVPVVTVAPAPIPTPIVPAAPVYQFVPSIDFSQFNRLELPTVQQVSRTPAEVYGPPAVRTYEQPAETYGPPAQ